MDAEPSETIRDFIYISLLTGARKSNVMAMAWADIDLDAATWTIPDTKSGQPVTLPLVPDAVRILASRPHNSQHVFPSRIGTGHLVSPQKAWRSILNRAGLKDLRVHDLRRTLGSWQAAQGTSLPIIGRSLGHSSTASTAVYARVHLDPVREAMTSATAAIVAAGKPKKKSARKGGQ